MKLIKPSTTIIYDDVAYTCGDVLTITDEEAVEWVHRGRCFIVEQSDEEE